MGICSSCESTHVATAKLVLQDGRLQEYSYPVKVSYVLQKNPSCFICNSDEMDFDDVVSPICEDEELQPGQLYFALPLNRLKRPLQPEEMAALAVKASAALMKSGDKCVCRKKSVCPIALPGEKSPRKMASGGGARGGRMKKGMTSKFTALLSAIPE
ncbi:hypothetical protein LWI29_024232 [Acer saccharum]|uniref:Uncharacterized protein n=1 Tax=Acer saccharum TaxID=4024 RepID=A0AA39T909_ACESA|nr:hypothetical protein LWI29_024232 [Acer saccharum]KAK1587044.1 hypothetical protein Q3G72_008877 [Acer saccharum]